MNRSSTRALIGVAVALTGTASADIDWFGHFSSNIGIQLTAIDFDDEGNVYATGKCYGNVDLDPGPSVVSYVCGNVYPKTFITKLRADGTYLNSCVVGLKSSGEVIPEGIKVKNGRVYLYGICSSYVDFDPGPQTYFLQGFSGTYLATYTLDLQFANALPLGYYFAMESMDVDSNGDFYLAGVVLGHADFDLGPDSVIVLGPCRAVWSISDSGAYRWHHVIRSSFIGSTCANSNGTVSFVCSFSGNVDFDPGPDEHILQSIALTKVDWTLGGDGSFVGVEDIGHGLHGYLQRDREGNTYVASVFFNEIDVDPGPGIVTLVDQTPPYGDTFIAKLSRDGALLWARQIADARVHSIDIHDSGSLVLGLSIHQMLVLDVGRESIIITPASGTYGDLLALTLSPGGDFSRAEHFCVEPPGYRENFFVKIDRGFVYVGGDFTTPVDFAPHQESMRVEPIGYHDSFLIRLGEPRPLPVRSAGRYALAVALVLASLVLIGGRCARKTATVPDAE